MKELLEEVHKSHMLSYYFNKVIYNCRFEYKKKLSSINFIFFCFINTSIIFIIIIFNLTSAIYN